MGVAVLIRRVFLTMVVAVASLAASATQPPSPNAGPKVGARVPEFAGVDQFGRRHTLQSVLGPEGAMLVFFRSADW